MTNPTQRHKGIPNKIRLEYEDYSNRVRNYDFLKQNEGALKSASVTYAQMVRQKNKIFIRGHHVQGQDWQIIGQNVYF